MLKFEDKFKVGDTIRAYDFNPIEGRRDCFVEGVVTEANMKCNNDGWGGFAAYVIDCTVDSWDEDGKSSHSRVGETIFVPMEVDMFEYDGRIALVESV